MKTKTHQFVVTIHSSRTKKGAKDALMVAFAMRRPDGCEFHTVDMAQYQRNQHRRLMRVCENSRRRMNSYTPQQRAELEAEARKLIGN